MQCYINLYRCYATGEKSDYLVFDDLTSEGFKNSNRQLGLDERHLKLAIKTLSKWHAATAVLYTKVFNLIRIRMICKN